MKVFRKILVANRGEIAVRIIKAARALGMDTVAVYSTVDKYHLPVQLADSAFPLGRAEVADSYLAMEKLINAAIESDADAIHPGYGFLAENADFTEACQAAGITFIGPSAKSIRLMGNKAMAKRLMEDEGMPIIPGYSGEDQNDDTLITEAGRIGTPLMIKAAAGGGGCGMRLVTDMKDIQQAINSARSETSSVFGNGELILEKALIAARHIEVQVFADQQGNVLYLGERDCSTQRRHQKIIEEAPSPVVNVALRKKMGETACAIARAIDYVGAGTVEFLLAEDGAFYFMEMNTRLQVEHPVTEMITGIDLVAWQIKVAQGQALPLTQEEVTNNGYAIEARLYAEDPYNDFLPKSGVVHAWRPYAGEGIRIDHGLVPGQQVSPYYDPMLGKIIAWGVDRNEARQRLRRALRETFIAGITTNQPYLLGILDDEVFCEGNMTVDYIDAASHFNELQPEPVVIVIAALLLFQSKQSTRHYGLSSDALIAWPVVMTYQKNEIEVSVRVSSDCYVISAGEEAFRLDGINRDDDRLRLYINGVAVKVSVHQLRDNVYVAWQGHTYNFSNKSNATSASEEKIDGREFVAPLNGRVIEIRAEAGRAVSKGNIMLVIEAMKMQHQLIAPMDAVVESVKVSVEDVVNTGDTLLQFVQAEHA